jgi:hypothetical protein
MSDEPIKARDLIEPAAVRDDLDKSRPGDGALFAIEAETSAAISLKRIADRLDDIASGAAALNVYTKEG